MTVAARLAEIRAREQAATPGPWRVDDVNETVYSESEHDPIVAEYIAPPDGNGADAEFIAHARTDLPLLLAVAEAAVKHKHDAWVLTNGCAICEALAALEADQK